MKTDEGITIEAWFDKSGNSVPAPSVGLESKFIHLPIKETEWGEWQCAFDTVVVDGVEKVTDVTLWRAGKVVDDV